MLGCFWFNNKKWKWLEGRDVEMCGWPNGNHQLLKKIIRLLTVLFSYARFMYVEARAFMCWCCSTSLLVLLNNSSQPEHAGQGITSHVSVVEKTADCTSVSLVQSKAIHLVLWKINIVPLVHNVVLEQLSFTRHYCYLENVTRALS